MFIRLATVKQEVSFTAILPLTKKVAILHLNLSVSYRELESFQFEEFLLNRLQIVSIARGGISGV